MSLYYILATVLITGLQPILKRLQQLPPQSSQTLTIRIQSTHSDALQLLGSTSLPLIDVCVGVLDDWLHAFVSPPVQILVASTESNREEIYSLWTVARLKGQLYNYCISRAQWRYIWMSTALNYLISCKANVIVYQGSIYLGEGGCFPPNCSQKFPGRGGGGNPRSPSALLSYHLTPPPQNLQLFLDRTLSIANVLMQLFSLLLMNHDSNTINSFEVADQS